MTSLPEIPADAGITLLLPLPTFGGRERVVTAWTRQLERLNRPFSIRVIESDRVGDTLRAEPEHPVVALVVPDIAYRPSDLSLLVDSLSKADLVLGVRSSQPRPKWLVRLGAVGRWISRVVFGIDLGDPAPWYGGPAWRTKLRRRLVYGLRVQDADCGFRVWRRDSLSDVPVQSHGRFALVEMIAKLNFRGGLIVEVALSRPGDLPTAPPFPGFESDEREVFRKPAFRRPPTAEQKDPGESDSPGSVAVVSD